MEAHLIQIGEQRLITTFSAHNAIHGVIQHSAKSRTMNREHSII